MDIRKIEPRNDEENETVKLPEKQKRTRPSRREKNPSPLSGLLAIGVIIGIGILFVFSTLTDQAPQVKGVQDTKKIEKTKDVEAASSAIKGRVDDRLENIKDQVEDLSGQDFVTDSPQVQKVINDLQSLQGLPADQARDVCESICKSIE